MTVVLTILVVLLIIGLAITIAHVSDLTAKVRSLEAARSAPESFTHQIGVLAEQVADTNAVVGGITERETYLCDRVRVLAESVYRVDKVLSRDAAWRDATDTAILTAAERCLEIAASVDQIRGGLRQAAQESVNA